MAPLCDCSACCPVQGLGDPLDVYSNLSPRANSTPAATPSSNRKWWVIGGLVAGGVILYKYKR